MGRHVSNHTPDHVEESTIYLRIKGMALGIWRFSRSGTTENQRNRLTLEPPGATSNDAGSARGGSRQPGDYAARELEVAWNGIGDWEG